MKRTSFVFLLLSWLIFAAVLLASAHFLPERLASHFNAAGQPDGWMPRAPYLWTMAGVTFGLSLLILGSFSLMRLFPASAINLPNKAYWLAPERRTETFRYIFRTGVWLACLEVWFMLALHLLLVSANTGPSPRLSPAVWLLTAAFLATLTLMIALFIRRFCRVA